MNCLFESHLSQFPLQQRGKVRDIYPLDDQHLLMIATDRLSAFDVVLPDPIPKKGIILNTLSHFWFQFTSPLIQNHLSPLDLSHFLPPAEAQDIRQRSMVVRKLKPLPIEAIVRGYLIGSAWKDYMRTGQVCDIPLPPQLSLAEKLPHPIYTPSSKAAVGQHDENISFANTVKLVGQDLAERVRDISLQIYHKASLFAEQRGIIIADTKFEFGVDEHGQLLLIDEVLTPDSSRFWPMEHYVPGHNPPSFDKQFVRDYLETLHWDKRPPAPSLPPEIIEKTTQKYQEAYDKLIGTNSSFSHS